MVHKTKLVCESVSNAKINQVHNKKIVHVRFTQLAWQEQVYNTKIQEVKLGEKKKDIDRNNNEMWTRPSPDLFLQIF